MIGDGGFAPRDAPLTASAYLCNMHAFLCRGPAELQVAAEIHQSVARRAAILRIIRESTVHNQDELAKLLRKQGFDATQSSVSRDLRELGVAKAGDHYILPGGDGNAAGTPFAAVSNFVTEVRTAGQSLTVVKTTTGTAQSVAVAIDDSNWSEVVGTISGDDTIFIATEGGREQRKLRERLRDIFGI
jgi:transcriptional regulator of arginine metabolism